MKSKNGLENLEEFLWFEEPNKLARKKNQGLTKKRVYHNGSDSVEF